MKHFLLMLEFFKISMAKLFVVTVSDAHASDLFMAVCLTYRSAESIVVNLVNFYFHTGEVDNCEIFDYNGVTRYRLTLDSSYVNEYVIRAFSPIS